MPLSRFDQVPWRDVPGTECLSCTARHTERSALLITNTSAISISPALFGLHAVAPTRVDDHHGGVGLAGHLDLDLADADGLDQDPLAPIASSTRTASGWRATDRRGDHASPSSG
jgi:hypothetical protein